MLLPNILTSLAILGGWASFTEWRIRTMYSQLKEKIEDKERINEIVQSQLKEHIARLEAKIDMLISMQINHRVNSNGKTEKDFT